MALSPSTLENTEPTVSRSLITLQEFSRQLRMHLHHCLGVVRSAHCLKVLGKQMGGSRAPATESSSV
jgi:hypothetical protein